MRIALFHNAPSGGAKRAIFEWTSRLSKEHTVDVYTLSTADHDFCDIRPFAAHHRIYDFNPRPLIDSPFGRLNPIQRWRELGDLIILERQIALEINAEDYDVVFANSCQFTGIPPLVQFVEAPAAYYLHEPTGPWFYRQFDRPYFQRKKWRDSLNNIDPLLNLFVRRADKIQRTSITQTQLLMANSLFTKEQMKDCYGVEASICRYGVDHITFSPESDVQKDSFLLSVGELSPRKGFDFLIESIALIPAEERPKLKIACNSVEELEQGFVQGLADEHQVKLEMLTNLDSKQLSVEYNKALLCVYSPAKEPFGLVPLESMSCGTPVIGVNEGGVRESIVHEHTGLLVDRDPEQFASAIQRLLVDRSLADRYGRNGREHILQNWTWEKSTNAMEEFLTSCANGA